MRGTRAGMLQQSCKPVMRDLRPPRRCCRRHREGLEHLRGRDANVSALGGKPRDRVSVVES